MDYKELWEALKEIDGHRKLKPFGAYPEKGYQTIEECMNGIEKLSKKNVLRGMIEHRRKWSGEDCG